MRNIIIFLIALSVCVIQMLAQVTIGSDIKPHSACLLDLKEHLPKDDKTSANRGLLLPRVALSSKTEMLSTALAGEEGLYVGLMVYHVGTANLCRGSYVWNGKEWDNVLPCAIDTKNESVTVNGIYALGVPLNSTNTITVDIEVPYIAVAGAYKMYTDTQNGMTFSATGILKEGQQTITLAGAGTPYMGGVNQVFTMHIEYSNAPSSDVIYKVVMSSRDITMAGASIFTFGNYNGTYGYSAESSASNTMLLSKYNFGTLATSTVKVAKVEMRPHQYVGTLTVANFLNTPGVGFSANPDIMIHGYESTTSSSAVIDALVNYLETGGVLILFNEDLVNATSIPAQICRKLFPLEASGISISNMTDCVGGSTHYMSGINDGITNGPFGDLRGKGWGVDFNRSTGIVGLPTDSIVIYTTGTCKQYIASEAISTTSRAAVTMFRHKRLNLFYVGDNGFIANNQNTVGNTSGTYKYLYPFSINDVAEGRPMSRINWGYSGNEEVVNSQIFGNIMTWAFKNARSNKSK